VSPATLTVARVEISRFWSSPARVGALLLVVVAGWALGGPVNQAPEFYRMSSDWPLAGQALQVAAAIAALLGCGWAAGAVLDDADGGILEMVIASGTSARAYVLGKIAALMAVLSTPAIVLAFLLPIQRRAEVGLGSLWPYLAAFLVVYVPTTGFAICFGTAVGTMARSRSLAIVSFAVLWVTGFVGFAMPVVTQVLDVTGGSLNTAFFQSVSATAGGVDAAVVPAAASYMRELLVYARLSLGFLVLSALLSAGALGVWLTRRWKGDALPLLGGRVAAGMPREPDRQWSLELRVGGLGRIAAAMTAALATCVLSATTDDPRRVGIFLIESMTPLLFVFAYASVFPSDATAGVSETTLSTPGFRRPYLMRLAATTLALLLTLLVQVGVWGKHMPFSVPSELVLGLAPALLFGGAAWVLGVTSRNAATASTTMSAVWAVAQTPFVATFMSSSWLSRLFPFPASHGLIANVTVFDKLPLLVVGLILFGIGLGNLGRPEHLLAT